jgi:hypothetical protein
MRSLPAAPPALAIVLLLMAPFLPSAAVVAMYHTCNAFADEDASKSWLRDTSAVDRNCCGQLLSYA